MKYSFMSFSCPELTLDEMVAAAENYGYDGIEPRLDAEHKHCVEVAADAAARKDIKERIAAGNVSLCCLATSCRFANPEDSEQHVKDALERIDLAGDVGAPSIRVFGGTFPEEVSREQAIELVVNAFKSIAGRAQDRGVAVCMETHDAWCNPRHVAEVMRQVNHPAIAVNWDIMHPVRAGEATMQEAFGTLKPWIKHIHFHDGATDEKGLHLVPIGEGDIDHRIAVRLLQAAGYDGYLSGEWISWEAWEDHLPRELATMKGYEG